MSIDQVAAALQDLKARVEALEQKNAALTRSIQSDPYAAHGLVLRAAQVDDDQLMSDLLASGLIAVDRQFKRPGSKSLSETPLSLTSNANDKDGKPLPLPVKCVKVLLDAGADPRLEAPAMPGTSRRGTSLTARLKKWENTADPARLELILQVDDWVASRTGKQAFGARTIVARALICEREDLLTPEHLERLRAIDMSKNFLTVSSECDEMKRKRFRHFEYKLQLPLFEAVALYGTARSVNMAMDLGLSPTTTKAVKNNGDALGDWDFNMLMESATEDKSEILAVLRVRAARSAAQSTVNEIMREAPAP